ncbi:hypothetical protein AgCh_030008 [Apium graveolens]
MKKASYDHLSLNSFRTLQDYRGLPFSSVNSPSVTTSNVTLRKPENGNIRRPTINESRICNSTTPLQMKGYCNSTPVSASNSQARMRQTSTHVTGVPFPSVNSSSVTATNVTLRTPETEKIFSPMINESDYSFSIPASAENSRMCKTTSTASRASILRNLKEGNVRGEKNHMRVPPVRLFADDNSQVDYEFPAIQKQRSEILSSCSSNVKHSTGIHQENDAKEEKEVERIRFSKNFGLE